MSASSWAIMFPSAMPYDLRCSVMIESSDPFSGSGAAPSLGSDSGSGSGSGSSGALGLAESNERRTPGSGGTDSSFNIDLKCVNEIAFGFGFDFGSSLDFGFSSGFGFDGGSSGGEIGTLTLVF